MAVKVTLSNLVSLTNETSAITTINTNFSTLATAIDALLSRDGEAPNQMEANLDMDSNRILNLPAASAATEPVRKQEFDAAVSDYADLSALVTEAEGYANSAEADSISAAASAASASTDADRAEAAADAAEAIVVGDGTVNAGNEITVDTSNGPNTVNVSAAFEGRVATLESTITGKADTSHTHTLSDITDAGALASGDNSSNVPYDNTASGLTATDVKAAIDELASSATGVEYYVVKDVKVDTTGGGTFTSGAWRQRDLNTEEGSITGGSLTSNQITLPAGTYVVEVIAPAYRVFRHQARLRNVTDDTIIAYGSSEFSNASSTATAQTGSLIKTRFTLAAEKVIEVQHRCQQTFNTDGFGIPSSFGGSEVYTTVEIRKIG